MLVWNDVVCNATNVHKSICVHIPPSGQVQDKLSNIK